MTESQEVQETIDEPQQIENARVGYQVAANLRSSGAQEFWSQFEAMIAANSIVLAAATLAISDQKSTQAISSPQRTPISIGMPIAGLALCALWLVLHERAVGYNKYWNDSARELEERFLEPVETLSRGRLFAEGQTVKPLIDGKPKPHSMPCIGRIRVRHTVRLIIAVFAVMYLIILVWGLN